MYTHIMKGYTVGQTLTRRLLRGLMSIPGLILDFISAILWSEGFIAYWKKMDWFMHYSDGTKVYFWAGLTGWIGDIVGYLIGSVLGIAVGFALYFPNSLLIAANWLIRQGFEQTSAFAEWIGNNDFLNRFMVLSKNPDFLHKSWNIVTLTIGGLLALAPVLLCKIIEFIFPAMGSGLSTFMSQAFSLIGGLIMMPVAIVLFPVIYAVEKICDLHDLINENVLKLIALVYAATDQIPARQARECCSCATDETMHSTAFRNYVQEAHRSPWTLFVPEQADDQEIAELDESRAHYDDGMPVDPFTQEPLGHKGCKTVIDQHGHIFNNYGSSSDKGIHFWVRTNHTCPLNRQKLDESDLRPNVDGDALLAQLHQLR